MFVIKYKANKRIVVVVASLQSICCYDFGRLLYE